MKCRVIIGCRSSLHGEFSSSVDLYGKKTKQNKTRKLKHKSEVIYSLRCFRPNCHCIKL